MNIEDFPASKPYLFESREILLHRETVNRRTAPGCPQHWHM